LFDDVPALLKAVGVLREKGHRADGLPALRPRRDRLPVLALGPAFKPGARTRISSCSIPPAIRQSYLKVLAEFRQNLTEGLAQT